MSSRYLVSIVLFTILNLALEGSVDYAQEAAMSIDSVKASLTNGNSEPRIIRGPDADTLQFDDSFNWKKHEKVVAAIRKYDKGLSREDIRELMGSLDDKSYCVSTWDENSEYENQRNWTVGEVAAWYVYSQIDSPISDIAAQFQVSDETKGLREFTFHWLGHASFAMFVASSGDRELSTMRRLALRNARSDEALSRALGPDANGELRKDVIRRLESAEVDRESLSRIVPIKFFSSRHLPCRGEDRGVRK